jgi:hypothetical protein
MGQAYWLKFKTNKKRVSLYLDQLRFPKDENFKKTIIIASDKTKTDCWLTWHGTKLEIASQIFEDQSAWCAAIANRLHEMFIADRAGSDSTEWWPRGEFPNKPFSFSLLPFEKYPLYAVEEQETFLHYKKLQRLFIKEAKRLLP